VLLEVNNALFTEARDQLAQFAELEKSPEHVHTYRITPLSLWNAAASGCQAEEIVQALTEYGKYPVPDNIAAEIADYMRRYGQLQLLREDDELILYSEDRYLITELKHQKTVQPYLIGDKDANRLLIDPARRGHIKQALIKLGYPAEDLAGYVEGDSLEFELRDTTLEGKPFSLRPYQEEAVRVFHAGGRSTGGSGVIVLPCGAGKTMVGMGVMANLQAQTLILCTNTTAVRQWIAELVDKCHISREMIGEYTGEAKELKPITVATYQILTYRPNRDAEFPHFALFNARNWGLIIYDEVHLLPAPVFRITAEIQARRRLGLTATLVREDEREEDVFTLIGPKRYDVPWKQLEQEGYIASATCTEIRLPLADQLRMPYATADRRTQFRIATENPWKEAVVEALVEEHNDDQVLVIGQYLSQLRRLADKLDAPLITGKVATRARHELYDRFRAGELGLLVVSKVANFSLDLPEANVAIQVSGTFGSRQEEAQRLGRILRPKQQSEGAHFYSLVTRDTRDQEFASNRQLFLTEQGYRYRIRDAGEYVQSWPEPEKQQGEVAELGGADNQDATRVIDLNAYREQKQ
jgi:DNA excision repair protein ERCC-3